MSAIVVVFQLDFHLINSLNFVVIFLRWKQLETTCSYIWLRTEVQS